MSKKGKRVFQGCSCFSFFLCFSFSFVALLKVRECVCGIELVIYRVA